jgi:hypothetical protein
MSEGIMKKLLSMLIAVGFATTFSTLANATVINLVSGDGTETCQQLFDVVGGVGGCTIIQEHNAWQDANPFGNGAEWISYANTGVGAGSFIPGPNSTIVPRMEVLETIVVGAKNIELVFSVWADDTAEIFIDGVSMNDPNHSQSTCANGPLGCEPDEFVQFAALLTPGVHTVSIQAYQGGGGPFGVLYSGTMTSVPEPGILGFLGLGLLGMGIARRRIR